MSGALFLGSSHVAAFKLAHDVIDPHNALECTFACARGADLAFTQVEAGVLRASRSAEYDAEAISYAFPGWKEAHYLVERQPTEDVGSQFLKTSGADCVNISHFHAIFYVLGSSPYDFARLKEPIMPISPALRSRILGKMLGDKHIMRDQIQKIRHFNPNCKHYLIAMPLKAIEREEPKTEEIEIVNYNRQVVHSQSTSYMFDDVYMPDATLLDKALLSTRTEFTLGGCAASEAFQKDPTPIETDKQHMNIKYGEAVFEDFVRARLAS